MKEKAQIQDLLLSAYDLIQDFSFLYWRSWPKALLKVNPNLRNNLFDPEASETVSNV